ncbi:MAG: four helix bundle protein [Pirellula sp.]
MPSNIAEACERGGKDFARFLRIAQGSGSPTIDLRVYPWFCWFCRRRYLALKGRRRIAILRSVTVMATPSSRSIVAAS